MSVFDPYHEAADAGADEDGGDDERSRRMEVRRGAAARAKAAQGNAALQTDEPCEAECPLCRCPVEVAGMYLPPNLPPWFVVHKNRRGEECPQSLQRVKRRAVRVVE